MPALLKIGIVGSGIGGLAASALLADQGHEVCLFDQLSTPSAIGSGLVIQPVGRLVLDKIGAGPCARSLGHRIHRMIGRDSVSGRRVLDGTYGDSYGLAIHRAALFDSLLTQAQNRNVIFKTDHKVIRHENQCLFFENGEMAGPFDLIIDASGVHSPLSPLKARALPYSAIWTTLDWPDTEIPQNQLSQRYHKASKMAGVMPIGTLPAHINPATSSHSYISTPQASTSHVSQKAAFFWSLPRDSYDKWRMNGLTAWKEDALALWPELAPFLDQITSQDQFTMARYSHGTLRTPIGSGIAYIGDAAHRASPQLGQGANMALLDAWALAEALKHFPLASALPAYARARRAHIWLYQSLSAVFTPQYQSSSKFLPFVRNNLFFPPSILPPISYILTSLIKGKLIPPLGYLTPLPPAPLLKNDDT